MSAWTAIFNERDDTASLAWESINALVDDVKEAAPELNLGQQCDVALLFACLGQIRGGEEWTVRAVRHVNAAIASAGRTRALALYGGLSGLGWTLTHVLGILTDVSGVGVQFLPEKIRTKLLADGAEAHKEIESSLVEQLRTASATDVYDLVFGWVGVAIYLLQRYHSKTARSGLEHILCLLERSSERASAGICWRTNAESLPQWQREMCPAGYCNLGVAHGVPGILFFLSELIFLGIEEQRASTLLHGGSEFLLGAERQHPSPILFDLWIPSPSVPPARLAWCYGDLGIAAVLSFVGRRLGLSQYSEFSRRLLNHCAVNAEVLLSPDAALCHGAAGVAHIMNRMYQSAGFEPGRKIAAAYYKRALGMRSPGTGMGGYSRPATETDVRNMPVGDVGFLNGAVGIALAFLGSVASVEPRWDRLLLLS